MSELVSEKCLLPEMANSQSTSTKTFTFDGLLEQWHVLTEYKIKLDAENNQIFSLSFTILGFSSILANLVEEKVGIKIGVLLLIPVLTTILLFYEGIRLRQVGALKGYLRRLEKRLNNYSEHGKELTYAWFSLYEEGFVDHNNGLGSLISFPVMIAFGGINSYCFYAIYSEMHLNTKLICALALYGVILFLLDCYALIKIHEIWWLPYSIKTIDESIINEGLAHYDNSVKKKLEKNKKRVEKSFAEGKDF